MRMARVAFACVASVSIAAGSAAAHTTFDLRGEPGTGLSFAEDFAFEADGIGLTVRAATFDGAGEIDGRAWVNQDGNGLGVSSSVADNPMVDGRNPNDLLIFEFDRDVQLLAASFTENELLDDFNFFVDFGAGLEPYLPGNPRTDIPGREFSSTYIFRQEWLGDLFGIGADHHSDDFRVAALEVSAVTVMPLPPSLLMLAAACAGVAAAGRRRRARA